MEPPTPSTPLGSSSVARREDVAKLQRKLQRSFTEKNMLLAEIQKLKEQLNGGRGPEVTVGGDGGGGADKDSWNRLLEANVRSGTMACMWCIKTQVVKMQALAFNKWKTKLLFRTYLSAANSLTQRAGPESGQKQQRGRGGSGLQVNTSLGGLAGVAASPAAGRRDYLLQLAQGILTKSSEKVPPRVAPYPTAAAATNARLSIDSTGSPASPLQASYAEFLQQRRQSLENNKNRRRASSSSPARRRSTSRGSSPTAGAAKLKPSYMLQTHSSKKKSGSPTPELRVLQGLHRPEVVNASVQAASVLPRNAGNYGSRSSLLPTEHHSHNSHHKYRQHIHHLSSASHTSGGNGLGLHDEASSVAASESMHVQDMSLGNATLAYRADQSAQRGRSAAPSTGQSKATRSSSSGAAATAKPMEKAQLRLLFEDLGDGHGHAHGRHAWSGSLRSHNVARPPSGKKPLRI